MTSPIPSTFRILGLSLALTALLQFGARATPYASGVTPTNGAGQVFFTMNEAGATVTVTFTDDLTTTNLGVLPKGTTNFLLGAHSGYTISCFKQGSGNPTLISTDTDTYSIWGAPRGVAVNKNAAIGTNFGRLCVGNSATTGKGTAIYLLNADQTLVTGPLADSSWASSGAGNAPWRIRANDDGTFLVSDFSTPNASIIQFSPDLTSSNRVFILGQNTGPTLGVHGDFFGCGIMKGSLAAGNLVLYTFDSGMGAPADTNCLKGPLTSPGSYNCVFKYNIGSGPLPWNKRPDYAYTMGLDGIAELRTEGDVGTNGYVYCGFGRANASNPNLQILRPPPTTNGITGDPVNGDLQKAAESITNWLYTGGVTPPFNTPPPGGTAGDPWCGVKGSGSAGGTYAGVRISPDNRFFASVDINNGATIARLTNGIPNDGTIFAIVNTPATGNSRGMDWDAADNLWIASSGQGLLRCYSLGLTATCVTSNDWTGTNGTFQMVLPALEANVTTPTPIASQNYVNNTVNPGTPTPGIFRISLNKSDTTADGPTFAGFVRGGTAAYPANYTINTNETPNGVIILTNGVIFPAGVYAGANGPNWNVDVKITPTAIPVSGPTLTATLILNSGTNYFASSPNNGTVTILNTGPQLLQLAAAVPATLAGMSRVIPNDYARFVITRLGDTNGPGNNSLSVVPKSLTVTNFLYLPPAAGSSFMAVLGTDYTAGPQLFTGVLPTDTVGVPSIAIAPGVVTVPAVIGNPVKHTNPNLTRTNLTVLINLTNTVSIGGASPNFTNALSQEGYQYSVTTASAALTEFDNASGGEVVLWSNPLTNSLDSTNWTLVYATIRQGGSPTLPTVISNYDNSANVNGLPYYAYFGKAVNDPGNDYGVTVPQSDTMAGNGWTTALKVSVNKDPNQAGESGINLYPQIPGAPWTGSNFMVFQGNYALRFDMFLSLYDFAIDNPAAGIPAREFGACGINHFGTNANWRLDINPRLDGTGARPLNADGEWCCFGASSGSITPADWDMFISPAWVVPIFGDILFNTGTNMFGTNDPLCLNACNIVITNIGNTNQQIIPFSTNVFIGAAFTNAYQSSPGFYTGDTNVWPNAGVPNDQMSGNNLGLGGTPPTFNTPQTGILKRPPFKSIRTDVGGAPDNFWVDVSLELTGQTNLTLKVAQQPIFKSSTITPLFGTANPIAPYGGTPMLGYLDPNQNISDYSAFIYYSNLRLVELSPFIPWTNQPVASLIVTQGTSFELSSGATFASNPLTNTWYFATTNGPTTAGRRDTGTPTSAIVTNVFNATNGIATLTVTSLQSPTNYISTWSDQAGSVTNLITVIEFIAGPSNQPASQGLNATFRVVPTGNGPPTFYQWQTNGVNLTNSARYGGVNTGSLIITNVQPDDTAVTYSCFVTNLYGATMTTVGATLTLVQAPTSATVTPASQTVLWGSNATFNVSVSGGDAPFTYRWKTNGVNVANSTHYGGVTTTDITITNATSRDARNYTAGVTNQGGGGVLSSAGVLTVLVPAPTLGTVSMAGGIVTLPFTSGNPYDTASAFILQSCGVVTGPYTNAVGASFSGPMGGPFQVTVPQTSDANMFYKLQHVQ